MMILSKIVDPSNSRSFSNNKDWVAVRLARCQGCENRPPTCQPKALIEDGKGEFFERERENYTRGDMTIQNQGQKIAVGDFP
jgi:hypothetical protein